MSKYFRQVSSKTILNTKMWADAQRDGRPVEYSWHWRPL